MTLVKTWHFIGFSGSMLSSKNIFYILPSSKYWQILNSGPSSIVFITYHRTSASLVNISGAALAQLQFSVCNWYVYISCVCTYLYMIIYVECEPTHAIAHA